MQHIDVKKQLDFVNKPIGLLITETELKFPIPLKKAGNTAYADIILAYVTLAAIDYINLLISSSLISNFSRQKNPFELF